jgi:ribonuclease R
MHGVVAAPAPMPAFRERLLALVKAPGYRPLNDAALSRALELHKKERAKFTHELRLLLAKGELVLVQGDRIAAAAAATEGNLTGRIQFRQGGSAFVVPSLDEELPLGAEGDAVQIAPEDTGTALPGDEVEVRLDTHLSRRRDGGDLEARGRVTRVIKRGRDTIVGRLTRVRTAWIVIADDPRYPVDFAVNDPRVSDLTPRRGRQSPRAP